MGGLKIKRSSISSKRYSRQRGYLGFTFVEMLLVLVVLVIVISLSIPNLSKSYGKLLLETTTRDIAYLMRYAQSRAVIKKKTIRFVLDEESLSYRIYQGSEEKKETSFEYDAIRGRWGRTFKIREGITIETSSPEINFYPDGKIDKSSLKMCNKRECMLISTEERRGRVQIFKLQ